MHVVEDVVDRHVFSWFGMVGLVLVGLDVGFVVIAGRIPSLEVMGTYPPWRCRCVLELSLVCAVPLLMLGRGLMNPRSDGDSFEARRWPLALLDVVDVFVDGIEECRDRDWRLLLFSIEKIAL